MPFPMAEELIRGGWEMLIEEMWLRSSLTFRLMISVFFRSQMMSSRSWQACSKKLTKLWLPDCASGARSISWIDYYSKKVLMDISTHTCTHAYIWEKFAVVSEYQFCFFYIYLHCFIPNKNRNCIPFFSRSTQLLIFVIIIATIKMETD